MSPSIEPFDEQKYKALMDGIEGSEKMLSSVHSTATLRFDSEYYKKEYLFIESFIKENASRFIGLSQMELTADASAFYPALEPYYNTGTIPFIRVADVKESVEYDNCIRIPTMGSNFCTLKLCTDGDVVLTKGGRVGTAGLITQQSYITRDLIYIDSSRLRRVDYIFLYLYYCSSFAHKQMVRSSSMTAQPHLTITLIKDIPILKASNAFKEMVSTCYDDSKRMLDGAKRAYKQATALLDRTLRIKTKSNKTSFVKSFSKTYAITGRMDAEYFQPKYDELYDTLAAFKNKPLGGENGVVSIKKSIEPGSEAYQEEGVPFVRVSDISKYGISEPEIHLPFSIIKDIDSLFPKKDTILFSKDGSVGIAYKVEKDSQLVTSGALLHLTVRHTEEVLPDYLTLVLNSPIVQLQAERDSSGAIIQHWKPSEIEQVTIPILDMSMQKEIATKVQESFSMRRKSKELLGFAKQAVEMAIEQGEERAMQWLNGKMTV